jgi:hypothetical protein
MLTIFFNIKKMLGLTSRVEAIYLAFSISKVINILLYIKDRGELVSIKTQYLNSNRGSINPSRIPREDFFSISCL